VKEAGGEKSKTGASVSIANSPIQQVESLSAIAMDSNFQTKGRSSQSVKSRDQS
jgi:hypothetical protein